MKVAIISATENEALPIRHLAKTKYLDGRNFQISFIETGVGILASCYSISKLIFEDKPDFIIQVGIGGTFDTDTPLGEVVIVKEEILADAAVEEDGTLKDLFDLNLLQPHLFPFLDRKLLNAEIEKLNFLGLKEVIGITVNEITTRCERIKQYKTKYNPFIESMEGASLHYCCLQTSTPFIQIRAVSNYIGERNKSKWNFEDAFRNLASVTLLYLDYLHKLSQY